MQPDLLFATAGPLAATQNISTHLNSIFAVMVLLISFFWAYRRAHHHTPRVGSGSGSEAEWLTLDLDLDELRILVNSSTNSSSNRPPILAEAVHLV
ncbi:MAG: hypothetical protein ACLGGW_11135, partial [Gammaproteobacteria bacterium]